LRGWRIAGAAGAERRFGRLFLGRTREIGN